MSKGLVPLLHCNGYMMNAVTDQEGDIEFEISGPDTYIRTRFLIDACEVWVQVTKSKIGEAG